jgi:hypothetical protein
MSEPCLIGLYRVRSLDNPDVADLRQVAQAAGLVAKEEMQRA